MSYLRVAWLLSRLGVEMGLGRIIALHRRSSTL
jgi:hypothetical protein